MKLYRDHQGRFASYKKFAEHIFSIVAIVFLGFAVLFSFGNKTIADNEPVTNIEALIEKLSGEKLQEKITELKHDVVRRLSEKCEALNAPEPESLITFDTGGQASIGYFQFYRPTVQHYIKQRDGKDISKKEATEIAMDWEKASTLAEYIIFDVGAGPDEWVRCFKKLELKKEVELINKLAIVNL